MSEQLTADMESIIALAEKMKAIYETLPKDSE